MFKCFRLKVGCVSQFGTSVRHGQVNLTCDQTSANTEYQILRVILCVVPFDGPPGYFDF